MVFKSPSNIYTSDKTSWDFEGEIEWNFQKFLVNKEGTIIKRYSPQTSPDDIGKDLSKLF